MTDPVRPTRSAVVVNPTKIASDFEPAVTGALQEAGWAPPIWLQTTEQDPGLGMARTALEAGVEVVLVAGGDGTVRHVAHALSGSQTALGIVPSGTGNLLARNLGLPLDVDGALRVILTGHRRRIDLIEISADDRPAESFAVMAGAGVDSAIMSDVDPELKKRVGPAAYFMTVGKALGRLPLNAVVQIDRRRPRKRRAMLVLVGNVGALPGGIDLLPHARADDGLLHVFVASPHRVRDWVLVAVRILTRRARKGDTIDSVSGATVRVSIDRAEDYQLDGDVIGSCRRFEAVVKPATLTVLVGEPAPDAPR